MDINEIYTSRFFRAEDLKNQSITAVIETVEAEDLADGRKLVASLKGHARRVCLNKTNSRIIAAAYGSDTVGWIDKQIQLTTTYVTFKGQTTLGLRVNPLPFAPSITESEKEAASKALDLDDLPF